MVASNREKYIAVGAGLAVGLLVLNYVANAFYFAPMEDAKTQTEQAQKTVNDNNALLAQEAHLLPIWIDMQKNGLRTDEASANSQLQHALLDWAQQAGVDAPDLRLNPATPAKPFMVIGYSAKVDGSQKTISRLLWALESATIPIRVQNLTITPQKEGTDALQAHLEVSTISLPQGSDATTKPAAVNVAMSTVNAAAVKPVAVATQPSSATSANSSSVSTSSVNSPSTNPSVNTSSVSTTAPSGASK